MVEDAMNSNIRRERMIALHTAKLVHARLLGIVVHPTYRVPSRRNIHVLQIMINFEERK